MLLNRRAGYFTKVTYTGGTTSASGRHYKDAYTNAVVTRHLKEMRMNDVIKQVGPVVGRCLVAVIFLISGIGKIVGYSGTAGYMASKGLPMVDLLLVATIIVEVGGSLMIIVGWKARLAAIIMFLWLIPVTLVFHNFWVLPPEQQMIQQIMFLKNLSIMGAMLYIAAFGPGRYSIDKG